MCSNLRFAWPDLVATMPTTFGPSRGAVFGASGTLSHQVLRGLPVDAFLSATIIEPEWRERFGQWKASTGPFGGRIAREPIDYARGSLAVYRTSASDDVLASSDRRIAIANPAVAPYGRAAAEALTRLGVDVRDAARVIHADSVAGVVRLVQQGLATAGWIAMSMVKARENSATPVHGAFADADHLNVDGISTRGIAPRWTVVVPDHLHSPIVQQAIYTGADDVEMASEFNDWISSQRVRKVLLRFGYRF